MKGLEPLNRGYEPRDLTHGLHRNIRRYSSRAWRSSRRYGLGFCGLSED